MHPISSRRLLVGVGLGLLVPVVLLTAQGANPPNMQPHAMGVWKLNLAKSKYEPGPPPKSNTRTYEYLGKGVEWTLTDTVDAQGNRTMAENIWRYDGKDYPTGNAPGAFTSYKNIDEYTMEYTQKLNGKVTAVITRTVSRDGKTMTHHTRGTNAQGQKVENTIVLEKQ